MMRKRCPATGMIVKARSLGSAASTEVSCGTARGTLHISKKSAPTAAPCIGWCCGGGPSDNTTDLPFLSWPVTTLRVGSVTALSSQATQLIVPSHEVIFLIDFQYRHTAV